MKMYKNVKLQLDQQFSDMTEEREAESAVSDAWRQIDYELHVRQVCENQSNDYQRPESFWQTAHIFISSTFRDMGAEREYIMKTVLPEVADWAEKRGIRLVETDLRWGVPAHSSSMDTIETCLGELASIKQQSNNQPLFLCLLGDRYGWVPQLSDIPTEMAERYNWIDTLSITHMEILQGAVRCQNRNALFCIRNPEFAATLTNDESDVYCDKACLERRHLAELKSRIGNFLPEPSDQVYVYAAKFSEHRSIKFEEAFGEKVSVFFKAAICRMFPNVANMESFLPPSMVEQDSYAQQTYFERRCSSTYGISNWADDFASYIMSRFEPTNDVKKMQFFKNISPLREAAVYQDDATERQLEAWPGSKDWSLAPLCLLSDPGRGKTGVMTMTAKQLMQRDDVEVLIHYCGLSVSELAIYYEIFLKRLILFLWKVLKSSKTVKDLPDDDEQNYLATVGELLVQLAGLSDKKVVVFLDGPEHLADVGSSVSLQWFNFCPVALPSNCQIVMSASNSDASHWIHSYFCFAKASTFEMPPLFTELRKTIVSNFFESYTKKLDRDQMEYLTSKEGAQIALWLKLACEELRVFGNFRQVTSKIRDFKPTIGGILQDTFKRLIDENSHLPIKRFFRYLAISPTSLSDPIIVALLGDVDKEENLLPIDYAKLKLVLKPYINFSIGERRIAIPIHGSLIKAAKNIATPKLGDRMAARKELATFLTQKADLNTKFQWRCSLTDLLWQSDSRQELLDHILYDKSIPEGYRNMLLEKFRCFTSFGPSPNATVKEVRCCFSCSHRYDMRLNGPVLDFCYVCKRRTFDASTSKPVLICPMHPEQHHYNCGICGMYIVNASQAKPLKLCHWCSLNSKCAHVSVQHCQRRYPMICDTGDGLSDSED